MTRGGHYLAKQLKIPERLLKDAIGEPRLQPRVQRYRVSVGDKIIGQFSNLALVQDAVIARRAAIAYDVSMVPSRVIYQDGKWLLGMIQ